MKVLVTGGAGFIGSNLAEVLIQEPAVSSVRVLDDLSTGDIRNLDGLDVEFVRGTLLNPEDVDAAVRQVDCVVHLGAIPSVPRSIAHPMASHNANVTGTLNLLEAVRRADNPHVIVASSSSVYGSNPKLPKGEDDWTRPLSPYGVTKLATEAYTLAYQASYGLDALAFRFFNVYGPRQSAGHAYAAVIPKFLEAVLHDRPLQIYGDGHQSRDFTYVGSVCSVIRDAVLRRVTSEAPVNLAFRTNTTLLDLVEMLGSILNRKLEVQHLPPRVGDVKASQADPSLLNALFPSVQPTPLRTGLEQTLAWYRESL